MKYKHNKSVKNNPTQEKIKFILELFNSNKLIETKKEIDRRNITVPDIHNLGSFTAKIKLHPEVNAEVNIEVIS